MNVTINRIITSNVICFLLCDKDLNIKIYRRKEQDNKKDDIKPSFKQVIFEISEGYDEFS